MNIELNGIGYENMYKDDIKKFVEQTGRGFFIDIKDILVLSAVIGLNDFSIDEIKKYKVISKDFNKLANVKFGQYAAIIFSIAICVSENPGIIIKKGEVEKIFNKCAGVGFEKLKEILEKDGETEMRNFSDFLKKPKEYIAFYDKEKIDRAKEKKAEEAMF